MVLRHAVVFDPRTNSVNALRLALAGVVLVSHSLKFQGREDPVGAVTGGVVDLGTMAVDGFFVVSGFLVTRSYLGGGGLGRFLWRRFLRIMPGFWVCLLVTAVVILPLAQLLEHGTMTGFPLTGERSVADYVVDNAALFIRQFEVRGLLGGQPVNGSLYTLFYELACYALLGVLGALGLLRRARAVVIVLGAGLWLLSLVDLVGAGAATGSSTVLGIAVRFGSMFFAGVILFLWADRIRLCGSGALVSVAVLVLAVLLAGAQGEDPGSRAVYLLLAPPAMAYLMLWLGSQTVLADIGRTTDVSYGIYVYAWPIQVLLLQIGGASWPFAAYTAVCAALAVGAGWLSWRLVERPAMRLRGWRPSLRRALV